MEINLDAIKQATEVLFSCKKPVPKHLSLIFNGVAGGKVNEHKHLGLVLDSKLAFEKHLNDKIIKAKKYVGILEHLSKFLPLLETFRFFTAIQNIPHCLKDGLYIYSLEVLWLFILFPKLFGRFNCQLTFNTKNVKPITQLYNGVFFNF